MKIAGFNINKKTMIIVGVVVAVVGGVMLYDSAKSKAEYNARVEEQRRLLEEAKNKNGTVTETMSNEDAMQQALVKKFGKAPVGFKWDYSGNPIAIGDSETSYEDIAYTYIRSLSILDFSTAQRYSSYSRVTDTYNKYYSDTTKGIVNYYKNFLRKQLKFSLTTLEINDIKDIAIFADGKAIITMNVTLLDLTDKDFWLKDKDELFATMRVYDETESDNVKKQQYVYDYIYNCYEDGTVGKRMVTIELVVGKENEGGWLVSDDSELSYNLSYENGVDVANYILGQFDTWYMKEKINEINGR